MQLRNGDGLGYDYSCILLAVSCIMKRMSWRILSKTRFCHTSLKSGRATGVCLSVQMAPPSAHAQLQFRVSCLCCNVFHMDSLCAITNCMQKA